MQRVPVAGPVAQHQRRRAGLAGARGTASSQSSRSSGHGAGWPSRLGPLPGDRAAGAARTRARSSRHESGSGCAKYRYWPSPKRWRAMSIVDRKRSVVVVEAGDATALGGVEHRPGRRAQPSVVELGGDAGPVEPRRPGAERTASGPAVGHAAASMRQQRPLGLGAAEVLADGAVAADHPVARHHDGHRVVRAGAADGPHRRGVAGRRGDGGVARRGPVGDVAAGGRAPSRRNPWASRRSTGTSKRAAAAGEVLVELAGRLVESAAARAGSGG